MTILETYGWNETLQAEHEANQEPGVVPARITAEHRGEYDVIDEQGATYRAVLSGRARTDYDNRPAVGDWVDVLADPGSTSLICRRYTRATELVRKAAGEQTRVQVIAANVDVVFVTTWPTGDFNLRRLERYITAVVRGGAAPVIVLTKIDLCAELDEYIAQLQQIAPDIPVVQVCALDGTNLEGVRAHLGPGRTGAFVGSSGVGKSTLVNALLGGQVQATGDVRDDGKGRHVTSHRELFAAPDGIIIDTPGMREFSLWADAEAAEASYVDVDELAEQCKFRDCGHQTEPGCAVRAAVKSGELDEARLGSYQKQSRELDHLELKRSAHARHLQRLAGKRFGRLIKEAKRIKGDDK